MSQRQVLILAATLAALGGGASAGEDGRAWIDPPAQVLPVPLGRADSSDAPASNTEAWPDEA